MSLAGKQMGCRGPLPNKHSGWVLVGGRVVQVCFRHCAAVCWWVGEARAVGCGVTAVRVLVVTREQAWHNVMPLRAAERREPLTLHTLFSFIPPSRLCHSNSACHPTTQNLKSEIHTSTGQGGGGAPCCRGACPQGLPGCRRQAGARSSRDAGAGAAGGGWQRSKGMWVGGALCCLVVAVITCSSSSRCGRLAV